MSELLNNREHRIQVMKDIIFPSGALTPEQLRGIFNTLPVDLTFTDADDRVRCLQSAFRPIPLVELLERGGHRAYVQEAAPGAYHTYVVRGR